MWKEVVMLYFMVVFGQLARGKVSKTTENVSHFGTVANLIFESAASRIQKCVSLL